MQKHILLFASLVGFSLFSCQEEEKSYPMSTGVVQVDSTARVEATAGTLTLAYLKGKISSSGNLPVERGLYLGDTISEVDTISELAKNSDRILADADGGAGVFKIKATLLKARTMYYYRFYVRNYKGESVSAIDSFFSAPNLPRLTIQDVVVDAVGDTVRFSGALTQNGGESVSEKGFVYSLGQLPLITDPDNVVKIAMPDTNIAPFSATAQGLVKNRTYYVRTYAVNRGGINYSPQKIFKTNP